MIYAIILIVLGLISIIFNGKEISRNSALRKAQIAPLFIVWGIVGIVILTTIRFSVFSENAIYWILLIVGSALEILISILFIIRYFEIRRRQEATRNYFSLQNMLGLAAVLVGVVTIIVN